MLLGKIVCAVCWEIFDNTSRLNFHFLFIFLEKRDFLYRFFPSPPKDAACLGSLLVVYCVRVPILEIRDWVTLMTPRYWCLSVLPLHSQCCAVDKMISYTRQLPANDSRSRWRERRLQLINFLDKHSPSSLPKRNFHSKATSIEGNASFSARRLSFSVPSQCKCKQRQGTSHRLRRYRSERNTFHGWEIQIMDIIGCQRHSIDEAASKSVN